MSYLIRNFIYMLQNRSSLVLKSQTPKTYKSKKLNTANFGNFSHSDYQVFLHLVSKIGGVDEFGKYLQPEQLQREHVLTAKEFSEVFNCDIHNSYRMIHKACKKLMKTSISLEKLELNEIYLNEPQQSSLNAVVHQEKPATIKRN